MKSLFGGLTAAVLTTMLALGGCGDTPVDTSSACTPGATQSCVCPGGDQGGQECAADGDRWLTCICNAGSGGGGSDTGSGGGGGGSDTGSGGDNCNPSSSADRIFLRSGGSLNGSGINTSNPSVTVSTGDSISGTIRIRVENDHSGSAIVPVIYTPSWGNHSSSFVTVDSWVDTGNTDLDVSVDLTAPGSPGTYFITFASAGQTAAHYVASVTAWPLGSSVWDDGNDIADLDQSDMSGALSSGYAVMNQWGSDGWQCSAYGITYVKLIVEEDTGGDDCTDPGSSADRIFLRSGGSLNGSGINTSNPSVTVSTGDSISGTIRIRVENDHSGSAIVPVIYTPSWGNHSSSFVTVDSWVDTGNTDLDVSVDLTAPGSPGTYFITFASAGQTAAHYVASVTAWPLGSSVWDDGNDIADLDQSDMSGALSSGYAVMNQWGSDGWQCSAYGITYVKLNVN